MKTPESEEAIFAEALRLPAEDRAAYLAQATGDDAELRRRVELLLASYEAGDFLEDGAGRELRKTLTITMPITEKPGDTIGRYKLLQQIGEGGCGIVYMAEQSEPVRRRVALKIIKLGMDTKSVIARFEAERQALAMMDHPNIAKVLDAGATEAGRPYFVMELVRGVKITDYCDEAKLTTRARLDLFIHVCHAIQHAHQKGIIHRDIKPSNILVTLNDGVAVPKVIDFGIAKATSGQQLTDKTLFTAFEQFIGTPAYMSPEQAMLTSLDIDTRSDIYALGVLLYELLTGKTPFDPKKLFAAGLDEMRRTIREQEPPRPSTCLSTLAQNELSTTAQRRGLEAPKLVSELRGDLDWIVMKALEKERARRYDTANGLAADIQRHLRNETVSARPPRASYRLQKFIRRNRVAVTAGSALTIAVAAGIAASLTQTLRALKAESERIHLQAVADKAHADELVQQRRASLSASRAEESRIISSIIADMPLAEKEEQSARSRVRELADRIKRGEGEDIDHDLFARFLARDIGLRGRQIQEVSKPKVTYYVSLSQRFPSSGIGVILRPGITMDRAPLSNDHPFPTFLLPSLTNFNGSVTTADNFAWNIPFTVGVRNFGGIVEAQLVGSRNDNWELRAPNPEDSAQLIGKPVSIVLPPKTFSFLEKLPENYPTEVTNQAALENFVRKLSITPTCRLTRTSNELSAEIKLFLPHQSRTLPVVLRIDLLAVDGKPDPRWLSSLRIDDGISTVVNQNGGAHSQTVGRADGHEYTAKISLPGFAKAQENDPKTIEIAIRSAREAALEWDDLDLYLHVPEIRKTVTAMSSNP